MNINWMLPTRLAEQQKAMVAVGQKWLAAGDPTKLRLAGRHPPPRARVLTSVVRELRYIWASVCIAAQAAATGRDVLGWDRLCWDHDFAVRPAHPPYNMLTKACSLFSDASVKLTRGCTRDSLRMSGVPRPRAGCSI